MQCMVGVTKLRVGPGKGSALSSEFPELSRREFGGEERDLSFLKGTFPTWGFHL